MAMTVRSSINVNVEFFSGQRQVTPRQYFISPFLSMANN